MEPVGKRTGHPIREAFALQVCESFAELYRLSKIISEACTVLAPNRREVAY